jgi:hypothetical protein
MENLMKFYRWMGKSYPVFQPSSILILNGVLCCGNPDTTHPEDDTYNGGTSFDGW